MMIKGIFYVKLNNNERNNEEECTEKWLLLINQDFTENV